MLNNCCWIDPDGKIYWVPCHTHGKFANEYMKTNYHPEEAIYELCNKGWLHIGLSDFISRTPAKSLSAVQFEALLILKDKISNTLIQQNIISYLYA